MHSVRHDIFQRWVKMMPKKRMPERNMLRYNRFKRHESPEIRRRAIEAMLIGNLALIPMAVTRYGQKSAVLDDDDFFQTAVCAMITAIIKYEPAEGKFSGYFLIWARQNIDRQIAQLSREIAIKPDALMPYRKLKRIAIENATIHPDRPDDMTLADYERGISVIGQRFVALDAGGDDYPAVSDRVGDYDEEPDDYELLHVALSRLNPREQHIMKAIYGINCEQRTQRDIGAELGVSGSRIGAIESVCRIKLKQFLKKLNPG